MVGQNEIEQIINLIYNGCSLEMLSFELDIPMEQIQFYKKQLELRRFAKESINNGQIQEAIEQLSAFIEKNQNSLVEKIMLLKLKAYNGKTSINKEELIQLESERKESGLLKNIDEILEQLQAQIPRRKSSNLRKRRKAAEEEKEEFEDSKTAASASKTSGPNYEETIKRYKAEISKNPNASLNKRNMLAFAYFKAGRIEEAREELMALIEERGSYTAYRQIIHLEKCAGNYEDAKFWGEICLEHFPDNTDVKYQLISIANEENDSVQAIKLLKQIIQRNPESNKANTMLENILDEGGR